MGFYVGDDELVNYLKEVRKHVGMMVPGPAQIIAPVAPPPGLAPGRSSAPGPQPIPVPAGQEFKPHMDWFWTKAPYWKTEAKRGGQRAITAMIDGSALDDATKTTLKTAEGKAKADQCATEINGRAKSGGCIRVVIFHVW